MKRFAICSLLFTACIDDPDAELALGEEVADLTRSPQTAEHPAAIDLSFRFPDGSGRGCTGSILSRHWILTAAHCVHGIPSGSTVRVHIGNTTFYSGSGTFIPYEYYDPDPFGPGVDVDDDIGLVRLAGSGLAGITEQAGVWGGGIGSGDVVNVIGFGYGTDPSGSEYCGDGTTGIKRIQDYTLTDVSSERLDFDYGNAKVCPGDSGGPWFPTFEDRLLVVGVTSAQTPVNDASASRADEKIDWIQGRLAGSAACPRFLSGTTGYWECFEGEQKARDLAVGNKHACAALFDGRVRCWGDNASGQLGNNTTADASLPVTAQLPAETPGAVWKIAAGAAHSCGVTTGGLVACWGSNVYGQLGNPNVPTGAGAFAATGRAVRKADGTLLSNVRDVAAGTNHTCALTYDENVYCWGDNTYGQLGNDRTASSTVPTLVGKYDTPVLDPGLATMAATSEATASAVIGPIPTQPFIPLADIQQLDVGHRHACAIDGTGAAHCWGYNAWGQLGNGTTTTSRKPVRLSLANVFRISAGYGHTCATYGSAGDRVACWGMNALGQLGTGDWSNKLVPTAVSVGLTGAIEVSAGKYHTCFTGNDRQRCTGDNGRGQLGAPLVQVYYAPVDSVIEADTNVPHAGDSFTCTVLDNGTVACAGAGTDGQLATGRVVDGRWFYNARDLHHLPGAAP